jgi:GTP-binding protein
VIGSAAPAERGGAGADMLEFGRWLFAQDCRFLAGVAREAQLPAASLPEIAFAGRSNVGKSSLVNALTGRKTLARTSNTPGRTQQLNFFQLGRHLILVDLPGYGFAKAAKTAVRDWTGLTARFLKGRQSLRRVCLLIDARHGLKDKDRAIMATLDQAAVSYQVILTKVDKLSDEALEARLRETAAELSRHPAAHPVILPTSALKGQGLEALRAALAGCAEDAPREAKGETGS